MMKDYDSPTVWRYVPGFSAWRWIHESRRFNRRTAIEGSYKESDFQIYKLEKRLTQEDIGEAFLRRCQVTFLGNQLVCEALTINNCSEILHCADVIICWFSRRPDMFKDFRTKTQHAFWTFRQEIHRKCQRGRCLL